MDGPCAVPQWKALVRLICDHHSFGVTTGLRELHGSTPVFGIGHDAVLKLYPPDDPRGFYVESAILTTLRGDPSIPAPELIAAGLFEGETPYVLMKPAVGKALGDVWGILDRHAKREVAKELGRLLRRLHQTDVPGFADIEARYGGWATFRSGYRGAFLAEMRRSPFLTPQLCEEIVAFLNSEGRSLVETESVLLHADLGPQHIFLAEKGGAWRVSALVDFADAMMAPAEYEWTDGLLCTFPHDPQARRWVLEGYYGKNALPTDLNRRRLANLFHSYAATHWLREMHRTCEHPKLTTLSDLAQGLFPECLPAR